MITQKTEEQVTGEIKVIEVEVPEKVERIIETVNLKEEFFAGNEIEISGIEEKEMLKK